MSPRLLAPRLLAPRLLVLPLVSLLLAGCEIPGLGPDPRVAAREADAKAVGGACRYGLRGIEDCYSLNPRSNKAAVYAGWKEMDQYMRENKVDGKASVISPNAVASGETVEPDASIDKATEKVVTPRAKPKPAAL